MPNKLRVYRGALNKGAPRGARTKTSVHRTSLIKDGIMIVFREHGGTGEEHIYVYTTRSCGQNAVEFLKFFARQGNGLNRYINQNRPPYEEDPEIYGINNISTKDAIQVESENVPNKGSVTEYDWIQYYGD